MNLLHPFGREGISESYVSEFEVVSQSLRGAAVPVPRAVLCRFTAESSSIPNG